ncbi:serine hydrolase domain-containing protein [Anabaena sp. FACHB-709]|uniref:Serine-type D-Ala-D-Ala carboxypeptidase n=2 Tax=Nostocaceae TaxID=1162 RepID=A0A1Z4KH61_ANAVA|nr:MULTISPECIES: serine hydrolase [Nostocaceae]BAY68277.1 serine-type D-Ala-D-Ala carboxypeptidase [Trichormus variabilis NIES-23]HBW33517.1 D-alanyl-D-alanine carboxypeptidase [Nostoc sp. UBA8866]MBD2169648.1 beta-lactamase family protein [Anabaena cylindrica FACHB-318]MBD2261933.1 beta-lactamase family protein [Anabaena sp. FACHB-709]MBD2271518.1 beta-lactamase family protein [Nostoc sp. PCC 7120 = FACHB-418]
MLLKIFRTTILTSALLCTPAIAQAATLTTESSQSITFRNTVNRDLGQQLQTALDQARGDIPGAAVAIISPKGNWFGASGVADIATGRQLQSSDRFQIGSITKTFVATTTLQLVEEDILNLDDKLTDRLPISVTDWIPNANQITLRQLLNHTSGVPDYTDVLFRWAAVNPGVFFNNWQPELLVSFIDGLEASFQPGDAWQYSNTNYLLLGMVVEAATNNSIAQEIRDRILEPLALSNTFFAEEETIPGGYVRGYWDFDQNGTLNDISTANLSWAWASGAMVSNTSDLATFIHALIGGKLLEPDTLQQMLTTISPITSQNYTTYGLGIGTLESPNRFWYIHRGQTLGYRSNMWYSPLENITYIELINARSSRNLAGATLTTLRRYEPPAAVPEPRTLLSVLLITVGMLTVRARPGV